MGLSSSLWTSVSGLLAHGEKMNVVGNNLANVSTIGFKSQRMDFEDFIYQDKSSGGGSTQVGFGVGINTIVTDFSQGSFESTNSATDLAINGTGYFKVVNQSTGADYFTRAGNFNFNSAGYLTLPSGEVLQGWKVNNNTNPLPATGINPVVAENTGIQTTGSATDILLNTWTIPPKATTKVEFSVNLDSTDNLDKSTDIENPLFAMSETWNGKHAIENPGESPISDDAYVYPAPITVYDEGGRAHNLTCYFDQVPPTRKDADGNDVDVIDGLPTGYKVYEYMLTMDPTEDARTFGGTYDPTTGVLTGATSFQDTEAAGILMKGTMIFNATGELVTQTAYTYMGNTDFAPGTTISPEEVGLDVEGYFGAAAADRDAMIDGLAIDDALKAQLKTDLPAILTDADNRAKELATAAAEKAGDAAGKSAGVTAVNNSAATIEGNAKTATETEAIAAGRKAVEDALVAAGLPATGADIDAAIAPGGVHEELYNTIYDTTYDAVYSANYQTAYDAVYDPAYQTARDARFNAEYTLVYNELSKTLPVDSIEEYIADIDASMIGHPDAALSWQPTEMSADGYPLFTANFSGHPLGNAVGQEKSESDTTNSSDADDIWMEFDLGLQSENPQKAWQFQGVTLDRVQATGGTIPTTASIQDTFAVLDPTGTVAVAANYEALGLLIPNERSTGSSTRLGDGASNMNFSSQNGYTSGNLGNIRIDTNGVLYGIYSNNVEMPLYQIAMYDFVNPQGLYREGGNLYSETRESGSIQEAQAGIAGMGVINAYNIEQSNVDMSREFVQMIATQRGFQSNSKGITTVDTMLEQVINMKR